MLRVACAVLLLALLAGCSDPPAPKDPAFAPPVQATATTGIILGVVVDDTITPIAGALARLTNEAGMQASTDADGRFAFGDLPPGTYFVEVSRFGYFPAQTSVDVVAGEDEPPVLRIQLLQDVEARAFYSEQRFEGFILCTSSVVAVCGAPNVVSNVLLCPEFGICQGNLTDDRFGFDLYYEANASFIQSELVWQSTQSLSTQLSMQMETITGCPEDKYNAYNEVVAGDSPLVNSADRDQIAEAAIGGTCSIFHSLFSGDSAGTPLGITVQQQYVVISHAFYGYTPPAGWRFTDGNGVPPPPTA